MQVDDARGLIAALGNLPPEMQSAGRRRVAERIAAEGVVDLAAGRVYRFKHGWIPLTHAAALKVTHGNHEKASALLAKHHGPDGSHTARVSPSKHGGFNVTHRGELQAHWNSEADAVKHAAKLNGTKTSGARVAPSAHGGFNVIHRGKLQGNHSTQAEADRHAARLNTATRPKARTSERTLATRQPASGRDKVAKGFVPQAKPPSTAVYEAKAAAGQAEHASQIAEGDGRAPHLHERAARLHTLAAHRAGRAGDSKAAAHHTARADQHTAAAARLEAELDTAANTPAIQRLTTERATDRAATLARPMDEDTRAALRAKTNAHLAAADKQSAQRRAAAATERAQGVAQDRHRRLEAERVGKEGRTVAAGGSIPADVSVRKGIYRGESGHLISGRDTKGRKVAVFVPGDRAEADRAAANIKAGRGPFDHGSVLHTGSVKPMDTTPGNRSAMTLSEQGLQDAGLTPGSRVTVGAMDAPNPTFSKAALPGVHTIVRPARNGNVTVRHEASGSTHDVHVSRLSPVETTPSVATATHPSITGEPVQVGDPVAFGKAGRDRWHVVRQLGDGKVQIRSEHLSGRGVGHAQATRTVDSSRLRHLKKGT